MEQRIDVLEVRVQEESEERERALDAEVQRLEARLGELSESLEDLGVVARRSTADVGVTLDSLNEEIRGLRGRIDELRHQIERVHEDNRGLSESMDRRLAEMEGEEAVAEVEARQAVESEQAQVEPAQLLARAEGHLEAGEHPRARSVAREFQRRWPDHENADEAQFYIAESYFLEGDYRSAILEFNNIRERHAESSFMPRALLRLGESFAELNFEREAGDFFDAVIRTYPDDPAAEEAREKKQALGER